MISTEGSPSRGKRRAEHMSDSGKNFRESVQLLINVLAAVAAVVVFFRYDAVKKDLDLRLTKLDLVKKDLDIGLGRIQEKIQGANLEKAQIEVQGLKGRKIAVEKRLRVRKLSAANVYKLDLDYAFTNKAEQQMEVRGVLAEIYVGTVPPLHGASLEISSPYKPYRAGEVLWTSVIRKAFVIDGDTTRSIPTIDLNEDEKNREVPAQQGGGGTGALNLGETSNGGVGVLVKASPSSVLAAYVTAITKLPADKVPSAWRTAIVDDVQALVQ